MRKIYLLLLLVSGFAFGQVEITGDAEYVLRCRYSLGDARDGCGFGGLQWLKLQYNLSGTPYFLKPDDGTTWHNTSGVFNDYTFKESDPVIRFQLRSTRRHQNSVGACSTAAELLKDLPIQRNETKSYSDALAFGGTITMTTFPVINLLNKKLENDIIGTKSSIVIPPIVGVLDQYYNWMYHIEGDVIASTVYVPDTDPDCGGSGGGALLLRKSAKVIDPNNPPSDCPDIPVTTYKDRWISLPVEYQKKNFLNIKCKDFLPFSVVGKKVQLRVNDSGKEVNLRYFQSAPIVESLVTNDSKCYDDTTGGSVRFVFDDFLMPGEQLNYALIDLEADSTPVTTGSIIIESDKSFVISNLKKGKYELQLIGFKDGQNTEVDTKNFPLQRFEIGSPTPVDFSLTKTDVSCNGGQDGTITISASGGTGKGYEYSIENGSWVPFLNKESTTETITGLHPLLSTDLDITYNIRVRDANKCVAKIQKVLENGSVELGLELSTPMKIKQPATPISLTNEPIFYKNPTFSGAENGTITASITGGTPISGNSYSFEWVNGNYTTAILASKTETQFSNDIYSIVLKGVPTGAYNLTVKDANGCTLDSVSEPKLAIVLDEPDPIEITLAITKPISCNTDNFDPTTGDGLKLADGAITATIKGGIPFTGSANNGLPYKFIWSKYNTVTLLWDELTDCKTDSIANLSKGNYSLNVEDANGIVQGTYKTTGLVTAIPTTKEIAEPTKLELSFNSKNVSCHAGNNGLTEAIVTGGAGNYAYTWYNTGDGIIEKNKVSQLIKGESFVEIKDKNGCVTKGSVTITDPPSQVSLNYTTVDNPTFSGATNGKIIVEVSGGTIKSDNSYGYLWKNSKGETQVATPVYNPTTKIYSITLDNLSADDYSLTVWDENYDAGKLAQIVNCSVLDSKITLEQPKPLVVTLEIKQTISCNAKNPFGKEVDSSPADGQRDESQDGIVVAHVMGGTKFLTSENNGLPYIYEWKKLQPDNKWKDLTAVKDSIAANLSHGNYALNIKDRNGIVLGTYDVNNNLIAAQDIIQFMKEPDVFSVSISKGDVYCNGGIDGWATATVTGGTTPYQYSWSNGETISENTSLKAGDYSVVINDDKKCIAKNEVRILEPTAPISLNYTSVLNPSFYKATNGKIVVEVKGGTPFADKSYGYEWKNSAGVIQTATSQVNNGVYTLTLNGLPEDIYSLTIKDANYDKAGSKIGCTIINSTKTLDDPDPLKVTFEEQRTISCNVSNEFGNEIDTTPNDGQRDESQDGILMAHVSGGIPLDTNQNNGLPYFYTWKKQLANGSWVIWNDHDETAEYLSNGIYALNVEDKNGIKLGTYVNNILTKEIDVTQPMREPDKLSLTFTKFDVGCTVGNDGWAKANVTGGTAPYTYQWTNEATTDKIENLTTNNYFVIVTDAKGCSVQGSIFVGDPNGVMATETVKNPTCNKGNDGSIILDVKGGNLPYTYKWNTGATTKDLNQLKEGNYDVTITCPDCCVYKKYFTLKDPVPIVVSLGPGRTLCSAQNLDVDATIPDAKAQYSWTSTNGFISNEAKVNLSKAGTYHVKVTSGLGCVGEDEIVIKNSNAVISSEFLLSSQAYLDEEVILVNTSDPFVESTNWLLPASVKIVEQKEKYITLKFDAVGVYSIGLQQTQGECYAIYTKNITVEKRTTIPNTDTSSQFIVDFIVTPNPSNGNFKALITLENNSKINLRLFSASGEFTSIQKKETGLKKYEVNFNTTLAAGMYILVLETEQQTLVKKIIIY